MVASCIRFNRAAAANLFSSLTEELRSRDAEDVMAVAFRSATLDVPAGGTASAPAHVEAPLPEPGEETSRQLKVSRSTARAWRTPSSLSHSALRYLARSRQLRCA
jgi:hypothetical protein